MNALPSFQPAEYPRRRKSPVSRQLHQVNGEAPTTTISSDPSAKAKRKWARSNPVYAHRRRGLEVVTKLVTYSTLSLFGMATLVHSIGYTWAQQSKLHHLKIELQAAKLRTEKINSNFSRSFDPRAQKSVMQENSYKIAPDRLQIVLVSPTAPPQQPRQQPSQDHQGK